MYLAGDGSVSLHARVHKYFINVDKTRDVSACVLHGDVLQQVCMFTVTEYKFCSFDVRLLMCRDFEKYPNVVITVYYAPTSIGRAHKMGGVCLSVCLSVACLYLPNSKTERHKKPKIGRMEASHGNP